MQTIAHPPVQTPTSTRIAVIGANRMGLFVALAFAQAGHETCVFDADPGVIAILSDGDVPGGEPGLTVMLREQLRRERLSFSVELTDVFSAHAVVVIAVKDVLPDDEPLGWNPWEELAEAISGCGRHTIRVLQGELPEDLLGRGVACPASAQGGLARFRITLPLALLSEHQLTAPLPLPCAS